MRVMAFRKRPKYNLFEGNGFTYEEAFIFLDVGMFYGRYYSTVRQRAGVFGRQRDSFDSVANHHG